jgi:hypothetical protein
MEYSLIKERCAGYRQKTGRPVSSNVLTCGAVDGIKRIMESQRNSTTAEYQTIKQQRNNVTWLRTDVIFAPVSNFSHFCSCWSLDLKERSHGNQIALIWREKLFSKAAFDVSVLKIS